MNAGNVDKACKSSGLYFFARKSMISGERVSNT
jgi:hypothetical protein